MKSFYQLLFQNETLYRAQEVAAIEKIVAEVIAATTALPPTDSNIGSSVAESPVALPTLAGHPLLPLPVLNHQILILVDEVPAISPANTIFLEKVLNAVKVDIHKVDILNLGGEKYMDFRALLQNKQVNYILSFGVPFIHINLEIMMNRYDPKKINDVTFLLVEPLEIIQADEKNKRALWNCLKTTLMEAS